MKQDYIREQVKAVVAKNPGIICNDLSMTSGLETPEFEKVFKQLKNDGIIRAEWNGERNLIYFNFGRPYRIALGEDFYSSIQKDLAKKGYRWEEKIFNDRAGADVIINVSRDPDPFWNTTYSCTALTIGWGRFERWTAWNYVRTWLDKGGFTPKDQGI